MGERMRQDQIQECKQCFQLFDKEGNGKVHVSELGTMVRALGQMPTEGHVKELIDTIIKNQKFTVTDLVAVMTKLNMRRPDMGEELRNSFRTFDRDGSGYVSAAELRHVLSNLGERMTDTEISEFIQEIDVDGDGQVNYDEVIGLMVAP